MTHITCRLTAKNRDQLRNPTLGDRVWATFTFLFVMECYTSAARRPAPVRTKCIRIVSTQRTIEVYETCHHAQQHHTHVAAGVMTCRSVSLTLIRRDVLYFPRFPAERNITGRLHGTRAPCGSPLELDIANKNIGLFLVDSQVLSVSSICHFMTSQNCPSCTQSSARC